jgi:predicted PurR-regulated permease PerM
MTAQQAFRNTVVVILTLALAYVIYASAHIVIVLLVAIIIASAIRPAVLRLTRLHVAEGLSILIVYFLLGLSLFLLSVVVLPPAVNQFAGYIENDQGLANKIVDAQNWLQTTIKERTGRDVILLDPDAIHETIGEAVKQTKEAIPALAGQFGGLLGDFVLVVVMGVYWLTSRDQAIDFLMQLFPIGRRAEIGQIIREIEQSMGAYVRGIVLVVTFVGVANFIILSLLGVPNPVTLGFIVGITTALPIIGGYIGAVTATLLALLSSPLHALFALGSFIAVQQVENHYLTPRVMSRSVHLNPILIIVFLFVGFALGGVIGALISVPVAGTLNVLLRHLVIEPRKEETAPQYVEGGILLPGGRETKVPQGTTIITTDPARGTTTTTTTTPTS